MAARLEIWTRSGPETAVLESRRLTIGKAPTNDIPVPGDATMSRLHAAFEPYGESWCVRDLGSRNGTWVNGERVLAERPLRHGDEVTVGKTRVVFRADRPADLTVTTAAEPPPELTRRERDVLIALCRPVFSGAMFTRPATIRQIAGELYVTENAVKQHLSRLYDKFGIHSEGGEPKSVRLANDAIQRGAVRLADVRAGGKTT